MHYGLKCNWARRLTHLTDCILTDHGAVKYVAVSSVSGKGAVKVVADFNVTLKFAKYT